VTLLGRQPGADLSVEAVNGSAGLALRRAGRAVAVVGVTVIDAKVAILWFVLNPAKLRRWHRR
jgi:RNA polymerase sigma-70 factor (ECF subfamily)